MTAQGELSIGDIVIDPDRLVALDEVRAANYAASADSRIARGQKPLIHPIELRVEDGVYYLVDGRHRLEALKRLKTGALVSGRDYVVSGEDREAARDTEIDANLAHCKPTTLDRYISIAAAHARADIRRGGDRRSKKIQKLNQSPESGLWSSPLFTKQVAKKADLSRSSIFEAVAVMTKLQTTPDVIEALRGTMQADNGHELRQVAEIEDTDRRRAAVAAIKCGQAKTVRDARVAIGLDKKVEPDPQLAWLTTISDIWDTKLDRRHREKFLADRGLIDPKKGDARADRAATTPIDQAEK